jgi:hypothetical protein
MIKHFKMLVPFLLIGPPVGFLAYLLSIALFDPIWTFVQTKWCLDYSKYEFPHLIHGGKDFGFLVSMGLVLSYLVGGIPAFLVGLISSFWHSRSGRLPLLISISAGLACAFAVSVYNFNTLYQHYNRSDIFNHFPYHGAISAITEYEWRNFAGSSFSLLFSCAVASWAGRKLALSNAWLENK